MHVSCFCDVRIKAFNALSVRKRSECDTVADLCLSACEHRGAVSSRNEIDLCCQRADLLHDTTVRSLVVMENHLPDRLLLILIEGIADKGHPLLIVSILFGKCVADLRDVLITDHLVIRENSLFHLFRRADFIKGVIEFLRNLIVNVLMLFFAALGDDRVKELNDLFVDFITFVNCFNHLFIGEFIGTRLDHDDFFSCGCNSERKLGFLLELIARIDDKLSVDKPQLSHSARTVERNVGDAGRESGAEHSDNFRITLRINRHYKVVKGHIIAVVLREQRAHRSVNDTACQHSMCAGLAFTLVETARDLTDCIHLLFKFYRQREEIDAVTRCLGSRSCGQHDCVTVMHEAASVCLFADTSDIDRQCSASEFH